LLFVPLSGWAGLARRRRRRRPRPSAKREGRPTKHFSSQHVIIPFIFVSFLIRSSNDEDLTGGGRTGHGHRKWPIDCHLGQTRTRPPRWRRTATVHIEPGKVRVRIEWVDRVINVESAAFCTNVIPSPSGQVGRDGYGLRRGVNLVIVNKR